MAEQNNFFIKYKENILHELQLQTIFKREELQILHCYIGLNFIFKKKLNQACKNVHFHLANFRQIRSSLPGNVAKMFPNCIIFSHIEYCNTNWSLSSMAMLKPIESLYRKC